MRRARVAELADAPDSKSGSSECGFESHLGHRTKRWKGFNLFHRFSVSASTLTRRPDEAITETKNRRPTVKVHDRAAVPYNEQYLPEATRITSQRALAA